jgi:hypothetical protein
MFCGRFMLLGALFTEAAHTPVQEVAGGQNQSSRDYNWRLISIAGPKMSGANQGQSGNEKNKNVKASMVTESPGETAKA